MNLPSAKALLSWSVAAACAAASLPVGATASASVSILSLTWTLKDLDPNDGIKPSLSFSKLSGPIYSIATLYLDSSGVSVSDRERKFFGDTGAARVSSFASAAAATGGRTGFAQASFGGADGAEEPLSRGYAQATATLCSDCLFTLSPNTAVTFNVSVEGWAETTLGADGLLSESAIAIAYIAVFDWRTRDYIGSELIAEATFVDEGEGFGGDYQVLDSSLSFSYANNKSSSPLVTSLLLGADAGVGTTPLLAQAVSPVPEPAQYSTMLIGLGALALARRRARRR